MTDAELEKLLTEKIMGWLLGASGYAYYAGDNPIMPCDCWHPLKSADQMFQAVDKVCEEKYLWFKLHSPFDPQSTRLDPGNLHWWASFTTQGATGWNGRGDYEADAPDMLHAIGLALLETMEVKDE